MQGLTSYYFSEDEDSLLEKRFNQEGVSLSPKLKTYIKKLAEYLASEYNMTVLQLLDTTMVTCEDISVSHADDSEPEEFADIVLEEQRVAQAQRYYNILDAKYFEV